MDGFVQMLGLQFVLLLYLLAGALCRRLKIITAQNQQQFVGLVLNILMPCMVFNSFKSITVSILREALDSLLISLAVCLVAWVLGLFLYRRFPEGRRSILRYATLVNNAGFAGMPLAQQTFGDTGLIYASVFLVPIRVFMWSAGATMLSGKKGSAKDVLVKLASNPNIIAVVLGLARGLLGIPLPDAVNNALSGLGSCVSPMSMIIIGAIIAGTDLGHVVDGGVLYYSAIRLVALPLVAIGLTRAIGASHELAGTCMILTSMPAGATTALLSAQYGLDEEFASRIVFVSTVLSLITAPTLMLLL